MSLTRKTAVLIMVLTIANIAIGFAIVQAIVVPEFAELEHMSAAKEMDRVVQAIRHNGALLDSLAYDWASWDETYYFVESRDPEYLYQNLRLAVLDSTFINWIVVVSTSGEVISGPIFDIWEKSPLEADEIPQGQWDPSHPLLQASAEDGSLTGILSTSAGPMLVASRDILTTSEAGPPRGKVVVGRFLDTKFIEDLSRVTRIEVDVWPASSPDLPTTAREALAGSGQDAVVSRPAEDGMSLEAFMYLDDILGNRAIVLHAHLPREITQRAANVSRLCFLWLLVQGGILVFLMIVPMHRVILAPLGDLSRRLIEIRNTQDLSIPVAIDRDDEIGELSREVGRMLGKLSEHGEIRRKADEALRHSEERLREAQRVAQVGSWDLDLTGDSLWWSDELVRIYGREPGDELPTSQEIIQRIHPSDRERVEKEFRALLKGESKSETIQARSVMENGETRHHIASWNVERGDSGKALRFFGTVSDVTVRHHAEEGLRRAAAVFDNATEGIVISDATGIIVDVNAAFSTITGYSDEEAIGQSLDLVNSGRHEPKFLKEIASEVFSLGTWEGEIWIRHKGGAAIPAWISIGRTLAEGDSVEQIVFIFNDMTERKKIEELIARQANYDMLTGIPNRSLFIDRLTQETLCAEREGKGVALLFIDLDNFKLVNDTLGHTTGDEVLMKSAMRIAENIREVDTVARVGGDEFAVLVPHLTDAVDAEEVANRILNALSAPLSVQGHDMTTTASIGIAIFPSDSPHKDALLRDADFAMYRSKQSGGNAIQFFTAEMNERALRRIRVESELRCALDHGEFEVFYQPIVSLPERKVVCVEALLRWNSPVLGMVQPSEFLSIAESTGVIELIGSWVLQQACSQVKAWQDAGMSGLRVAVNLSAREVDRGDPCKSIANALQESGLLAEHLEIEVTEQVLLKDVARATATFEEMTALGVRLSIDDFGTGYSALSYLRSFPFDILKIDRAFVCDATVSAEGLSLLRAIIAMAKSLNLEIIGEGVELGEQYELLCELGCEFAQGHFFAEPQPASAIALVGGLLVDSDAG